MAEALEELLREFLLVQSTLEPAPQIRSPGVIAIFPTHEWAQLDDAGRAIQAKLLTEYARYSDLVTALLRRAPEPARSAVAEAEKTVREIIDQSEGTYSASAEDVLNEAISGVRTQLEQVKSLYDPAPGQPVFVPDANAIIWNQDLEEWAFDDAPRFSIVLTSTLLGELDDLKMPHRGESVREKAEGAIRRINEYGRRGDIHAGVTLRRDRSAVRMTAVEPDFEKTLPWLDRTIKDDRLLAACLEIVREHPHSPVVLVTRDVNVKNKARHAGIPFVEPPPPSAPAQTRAARPTDRGDVRIIELKATGGSNDHVSFAAKVQNYGTGPTHARLSANVDEYRVQTVPEELDLLANAPPESVVIRVDRRGLGDLMPECNNETTLYGRELVLTASAGDRETVATWSEAIYDPETDVGRNAIQQSYWRIGRGNESVGDLRAEARRERDAKRNDAGRPGPPTDRV